MHRRLGGLLVLSMAALPLGWAAPSSADDPSRGITVTGTGISTWPAYDADVPRFAIDTTHASDGSITVVPETSDPDGYVSVDGVPSQPGEPVQLSGLEDGDEVSVTISDSQGTTHQSFVYLPVDFPRMVAESQGGGPAPGRTFLTLTSYGTPSKFETVVDERGVPVHVRETLNPMDLKLQPNGSYSVARGETTALDSSFDIVELDAAFEPVASHTTVGLENTEFHDSILLPDGGKILMAYEPNPETKKIDSVVQEIAPDGEVLLTWNSADHIDPAVDGLTNLKDYAHLNSIDVMDDGNLLLSFRHTSQLMKIDRTTGEVIWRLGGVASDFTFPDDPYAGPCAQHTAREMANGHIQVYDNGSTVSSMTLQPMCPDPEDPTGPAVTRPLSRVTEYSLDEETGEAHLVWQHETGQFSEFAGSAQRLGDEGEDDHTVIGTADGHFLGSGADAPDVLEVTRDGDVVWSLDAPDFFSYRALRFPAPDAVKPTIEVGDLDGAVLREGAEAIADFRCTDRGGSAVVTCGGDMSPGEALDTSPGDHEAELVAVDGAGNTTTRSVSWTVRGAQPDARLRKADGAWVGTDVHGPARDQELSWTIGRTNAKRVALVRVGNDGTLPNRIRLTAGAPGRHFKVTWKHAGVDVTKRLRNGKLRTPVLAAGDGEYRLKVVVRRLAGASSGDRMRVALRAVAQAEPRHEDAVRLVANAR